MDKIIVITVLLLAAFCAPFAMAQRAKTAIDRYIDESTNILIVRCRNVGPVNILLQARIDVDVLHVVKGDETLRELSVISRVPMTPGNLYVLRTTKKTDGLHGNYAIDSHDSAIPIAAESELDVLKTLSPEIVVLRTMNIRADRLDAEIRSAQYELDTINKIRKDN